MLPGIFQSIVMQIFLLFADKILRKGAKVSEGGGANLHKGTPCPHGDESQNDKILKLYPQFQVTRL